MSLDALRLMGVYPRLLSTIATRFNWAYRDGYPDLRIVQWSFVFTLLLLNRYGSEWRDTSFYESAFVRAYPQALAECPPTEYATPESMLARCYRIRALDRFAVNCGLAEMETVGEHKLGTRRHRVRRLPLLEAVVWFRA